jgi:hypothetical protein
VTAVKEGEVSWQIVTPEEVRRDMKVRAAAAGRTLKAEVRLALVAYLAAGADNNTTGRRGVPGA